MSLGWVRLGLGREMACGADFMSIQRWTSRKRESTLPWGDLLGPKEDAVGKLEQSLPGSAAGVQG